MGECEKMTADWSYQSQFRSYNPEGGKGTGEIIWMDGFNGQSVYVDRKADLVIVQLAVDKNYGSMNDLLPFFAISSYFRCNPQIGTDDKTTGVNDTEVDIQDTEDDEKEVIESSGASHNLDWAVVQAATFVATIIVAVVAAA